MVVFNNAMAGAAGSGGAAGYTIDNSLRFDKSAGSYIEAPTLTSGKDTYTISLWVKRSQDASYDSIFSTGVNGGTVGGVFFDITDGQFYWYFPTSGGTAGYTEEYHRDYSAWCHVVFSVNSSTATIYFNGVAQVPTAGSGTPDFGTLTSTLYFGAYSDVHSYPMDGYLADIHFIDGQAKAATDFGEFDADTGVWNPIEYAGTYGSEGFHLDFSDRNNLGTDSSGNGNHCTAVNFSVVDEAQGPGSVSFSGGVGSTAAVVYGYGFPGGTTAQATITASYSGATIGESLYLRCSNFPTTGTGIDISGDASENGTTYLSPTPGVLNTAADIKITPTATSGTVTLFLNGSGQYNIDLTLPALTGSECDLLFDSPTNGDPTLDTGLGGELPGNYATWNPLTLGTYTNGNLDSSNDISQIGTATIGVSSGKWYWEVTKTDSGTTHTCVGVTPQSYSAAPYLGWSGNGYATYFFNGNLLYNGAGSGAYGAFSQGDILNVALDLDNGKVWFGKNGTWFNSGNPAAGTNALGTGLTGTWYPGVSSASSVVTTSANFGQRPFAYQAPSGFKSLCTANLPTPDIEDGSTAMDVVTYTGNGTSQSISGLGFSPDLVWVKRRDFDTDHGLFDTVRGAHQQLASNDTYVEQPYTNVLSFTTDGFDVNAAQWAGVNATSSTYVGWTWDGGTPPTRTHTQPAYYSSSTLYTTAADVVANATPRSGGDSITNEYVYIVTNSGGRIGESVFSTNGTLFTPWYMLLREGGSWTSFGSYGLTNPASFEWKQDFVASSSTYTCANNVELHMISSGTSPAQISVTLPYLATTNDDGAVANTAGTIESRVRANPDAGFSIVSYTGTGVAASVGHGLNATPSLVIVKNRDTATNWEVYHSGVDPSVPQNYKLELNGTGARQANSNTWNNTAPTSSVFTVGTNNSASTADYIAYCFAPVEGYSAFGSYTGNGSTTKGAFVNLGFKPAWVMVKRADATSTYSSWAIYDSTRSPFNVTGTSSYNLPLWANLAAEEGKRGNGVDAASGSSNIINLFSNGFQALGAGAEVNVANETYIYAAFAEHPFKYARAR